MRPDSDVVHADLTATLAQVANQFFARFELRAGGLIPIKVADQANPERDVVQVIAVHVSAIDLTAPAIAHFYQAVAARCSVTDHEMISKAIPHAAHLSMIIIERARVSLPRSTIVDDDKLPAPPLYRRAANRVDNRTCQIAIRFGAAQRPGPKASARRRRRRRFKTLVFLDT